MPNLDELLGLINPAQGGTPITPQPEPEDEVSAILRGIQDIETQNKGLNEREATILKAMGVSPRKIQEEMIASDKPKGFWKTLGKFGAEALTGAAMGKGYVPYSERMYGKAVNEYEAQSRANEKQLSSLTQQKNKITDSETKLRAAAARMGVDYDKLALQKDALDFKRTQHADGAPKRKAEVSALEALVGVRGAQAENLGAKTQQTVNATEQSMLNGGLSGRAGFDYRLTHPSEKDRRQTYINYVFKPMKEVENKAKGLAPQRPSGNPFQFSVQPNQSMYDPESGSVTSGMRITAIPKNNPGGFQTFNAPGQERLIPLDPKTAEKVKDFHAARMNTRAGLASLAGAFSTGHDNFTGPFASTGFAKDLRRAFGIPDDRSLNESIFDIASGNALYQHAHALNSRVPMAQVDELKKALAVADRPSTLDSAMRGLIANDILIEMSQAAETGALGSNEITSTLMANVGKVTNKYFSALKNARVNKLPAPDAPDFFKDALKMSRMGKSATPGVEPSEGKPKAAAPKKAAPSIFDMTLDDIDKEIARRNAKKGKA
jgi:hypothetical protein